jgi:hypothetical protein
MVIIGKILFIIGLGFRGAHEAVGAKITYKYG